MADNNIQINLDRRTVQLLGFALAIAASLYLINHNPLSGGDNTPKPTSSLPSAIAMQGYGPAIVTVDELKAQATKYGLAAYWGGEVAGTQLELTVTTNGSFFVRYLPEDATVGTKDEYLDRKSTRLNSSHTDISRMPSSA